MDSKRDDLVVELSDYAWALLSLLGNRFLDANRGSIDAVLETILDFAIFAIDDEQSGHASAEPWNAIEALSAALSPDRKIIREAIKCHRSIDSLTSEMKAARKRLGESLEIETDPRFYDDSEGLGVASSPTETMREAFDWFSSVGNDFIASSYRASGGAFSRSCSSRVVVVRGATSNRFGTLCKMNSGEKSQGCIVAAFVDLVLQFIRCTGSVFEDESESLRESLLWRYLLLRTLDKELQEVTVFLFELIDRLELEFSRSSVLLELDRREVPGNLREAVSSGDSTPEPLKDWEDFLL